MRPCSQHMKAVALLAAGVLGPAESQRVREHVRDCGACREYWEELVRICDDHRELSNTVPSVSPRPGFHTRLRERIHVEPHGSFHGVRAWFRRWRDASIGPVTAEHLSAWALTAWPWKLAAVGAVVAIFVVGELQFRPRVDSTSPMALYTNAAPRTTPSLDSSASYSAYRLAASKSTEALDKLLARNAAKPANGGDLVTPLTREMPGLTD